MQLESIATHLRDNASIRQWTTHFHSNPIYVYFKNLKYSIVVKFFEYRKRKNCLKSGGRNSTPSLATYAQCALVFILVGVRCTWCRGQRQLQWMVRSLRPLPRINPSERESWKLCLRSASFHQVSKMGQGSPRGLFPRKKDVAVRRKQIDLRFHVEKRDPPCRGCYPPLCLPREKADDRLTFNHLGI